MNIGLGLRKYDCEQICVNGNSTGVYGFYFTFIISNILHYK